MTETQDTDGRSIEELEERASNAYPRGDVWLAAAVVLILLSVSGLVGLAVALTVAPDPFVLTVWALLTIGMFGASILLLYAWG